MKTAEFNRDYMIDRKAKGVKAMPKNAPVETVEVMTADGAVYDSSAVYYFFDPPTQQVRQSVGLRRDGEYLSTFGLRVAPVAKLRARRVDALTDGQNFFESQMHRLLERSADFQEQKDKEKTK